MPPGVRAIRLLGGRGLLWRCLATADGDAARPAVILLHGFPELAFTWRHALAMLGAAGYRAVAPDLRGYGGTLSREGSDVGGLARSGMLELVADLVDLAECLGLARFVVVGHDFGSPLAAWTALTRPDVAVAAVLMSAPFAGPPTTAPMADDPQDRALAALDPPRKHYQRYFCEPNTDGELRHCAQGLRRFLRGYFHTKSADWRANAPFPLRDASASELARLPFYYVMPRSLTMPEVIAPHEPPVDNGLVWLPPDDLDVYAREFAARGFQGGLDWYRAARDPDQIRALTAFAGRRILVPVTFIAGQADWAVHQTAGALARMSSHACADFRGVHLLPGAGHWVQQEQPDSFHRVLLAFLRDLG